MYSLGVPERLAVLDVIAEPTRRRILDAVREGERSVGEFTSLGEHRRHEVELSGGRRGTES